MNKLLKDWFTAFESINVKVIPPDTAARILAVVCVYGNNEFMIYNPKCVEEIAHIQRAYRIQGGEIPDAEIVPLIRKYVKELEGAKKSPEWAKKLFKDRYGIKLMNE